MRKTEGLGTHIRTLFSFEVTLYCIPFLEWGQYGVIRGKDTPEGEHGERTPSLTVSPLSLKIIIITFSGKI